MLGMSRGGGTGMAGRPGCCNSAWCKKGGGLLGSVYFRILSPFAMSVPWVLSS